EGDGAGDLRVARIKPGLPDALRPDIAAPMPPLRIGEPCRDILAEAERLAGIADGAARPVMDHRGDDAGAVAAVFLINMLDHLLAALMLEIDIDIGRLA